MNRPSEHRNGEILKQSYLLKKGRVSKKWKLGYFVLSKECLFYYRTEKEWKENAPKELIFFNDMSLYIEDLSDKETKYCIKIVKKLLSNKIASRTYLLCCFSEEERNKWLSEILYAKATALVVDPKKWIGNRNTSRAKGLHLDFPRSAKAGERMCAKEAVLQRCGVRYLPSCMSGYNWSATSESTISTTNSTWKNNLLLIDV